MKPIRPAFSSRKDSSDELPLQLSQSGSLVYRMARPQSMKVDNELQFRDGVDKNFGSASLGTGSQEASKEDSLMKRREFTKVLGAVAAGLAAGSALSADEKDKAKDKPAEKAEQNICKSHNSCKGKGGCKTGDNGCAGKNSCKGKGGCASKEARHSCGGQNACKGLGGCKTGDNGCAGKNSCKTKGGCAVPVAPPKAAPPK
jgi:hypothetical protein